MSDVVKRHVRSLEAQILNVTDALYINGTPIDVDAILVAPDSLADLNGEKLVIDADADTYIRQTGGPGGTDDSVDVYVAGALDFQIIANTLIASSGSKVTTNTIDETTAGTGVTIDGALVKDGGAVFADGASIEVDTVNEATSAAGVTIDGLLIKDGGLVLAAAQAIVGNLRLKPQQLTASGAFTQAGGLLLLNHASVVIVSTLAAPAQGDFVVICDNSATGTAAHTVTLPAGVTFDGTNDIATFNALGETLVMIAISATRWLILLNIGSVALSAA